MGNRFLFSVGEPSGDIHGANLIRALRRRLPDATFTGLGGPLMKSAGCDLIFPLADHPIMGVGGALRAIPFLIGIAKQLEEEIRREKPAAVILIDYPGFNWHVAKLSKRLGVPVVYYVPPQIWAWATHRVRKMRKFVDHVLCSLPFEDTWFKSHGIEQASYVGHPFFDDLKTKTLDDRFVEEANKIAPIKRVVLLPGSRSAEARLNTRSLLRTAAKIRSAVPNVQIDVAAFNEKIEQLVHRVSKEEGIPIDVHVGKTRELIHLADAAVSVSGSVSLELLYFNTPSVVVYHVNWFWQKIFIPIMVHTPYVTLVNLLAGRRIFPEFIGPQDNSATIAGIVSHWLLNEEERKRTTDLMRKLKQLYASPGASDSAARYIVERVLDLPVEIKKAA
ncbi:lipid-A-disaccharide synthase [bacterium]|nr:lipid-A-disaccharide synthase [bacterium]